MKFNYTFKRSVLQTLTTLLIESEVEWIEI